MARIPALLMTFLTTKASAHSALTFPPPREAADASEKPWNRKVPGQVPFEPWCPFPSDHAAGHDPRNLTGANGQACFWFSNGCAIGCDACDGSTRGPIPAFECAEKNESQDSCDVVPEKAPHEILFGPKAPICGPEAPEPRAPGMSMKATICDPELRTVNTAAACGSAEDYYYYSPWRAPGFAPVIDSCGTAGGRLPGQGPGGFGADYIDTTHVKLGDLGSQTLEPGPGVRWVAGREFEVAWTLQANHGGGYSYRMCPAGSELTEECFNQQPLRMIGQSALRWGGIGGRTLAYDAVSVTEGTKAGVMWRRNPVPRAWKTKEGKWGPGSNHRQSGMGFQPLCEDQGMDRQGGTESCTGQWGPYNLEIVDKVLIPEDLMPGEWVLNWRMDQEESNQIWQSCADVMITISDDLVV